MTTHHQEKYAVNSNQIEASFKLTGVDNRMIALLSAIDEQGSLNQAAKTVGLSYKGAWQMVERANQLALSPLVKTEKGGSKGGGTALTSAGKSLLTLFMGLENAHQRFIEELNKRLIDNDALLAPLKCFSQKNPVVNHFTGMIHTIKWGSDNAEVVIVLPSGLPIMASIPLSFLESFGLSTGKEVYLLIDSINIILMTSLGEGKMSARNQLKGVICERQSDGARAQVTMTLETGDVLVVTITEESVVQLGLEIGSEIYAIFKSNSVDVGVNVV
ncbi:MAG TPA: molybdenum-dependent transcriptional regulator [Methylococcaceae bacterium]|nr:molybdenum-dependent transcriptional regulator [Methylococcaceae bacterium]